jgi:hypothetical protein
MKTVSRGRFSQRIFELATIEKGVEQIVWASAWPSWGNVTFS